MNQPANFKSTLTLIAILFFCVTKAQTETEPNNTAATANAIVENVAISGSVGLSDAADYFVLVLPEDGTLTLYVEGQHANAGNHWLQANIYDGRSTSYIGGNVLPTVASGILIKDTIEIRGVAKDSIYVKISASTTYSYTIRITLTEVSTNDSEPNGSFATATLLLPGETKYGHLGYKYRGLADANDYYKFFLPKDGTVKIHITGTLLGATSGWISNQIYNGEQSFQDGEPGGGYLEGKTVVTYGTIISDSNTLIARYSDTFYIQINGPIACKYNVRYEYMDTAIRDEEPNNTFETATILEENTVAMGNKGYKYRNTNDGSDYYKAPESVRGNVIIKIEGNQRSVGGTVSLSVYDQRKSDSYIHFKSLATTTLNEAFSDTMQISCFNGDSMFIRLVGNAAYDYKLSYTVKDMRPKASMENERMGNTIGFRPQLANADGFSWDFGDGSTSTLKYPLKTYTPGVFTAKLIASNSQCGLKDTATQNYEIIGVEYYTPEKGGNGGDITMKIFGGGLDTLATISLILNSEVIKPLNLTQYPLKNQLDVTFDVHQAEIGLYDVVIEIPGQPKLTYPNGFRLEEFKYPYTYSQIVAPLRWRTNVDNKSKLVVGNLGNVNAAGAVVVVVWPKSVELTFNTEWFKPPKTGDYIIDIGDTIFNFKWEDVDFIYSDSFISNTAIDSFNGQPYDGFARVIIIPKIAPYSTVEIPLTIKSSSTGNAELITYTIKPNIFGSGTSGSMGDAFANTAVEALDGLDLLLSSNPRFSESPYGYAVKAIKATTTHIANTGQVMGATYNYLNGTSPSIAASLPADFSQNVSAGNYQVAKGLVDFAVDHTVKTNAANLMKGQRDNLVKHMMDPNASVNSLLFAVDNLNDIDKLRKQIKNMYDGANNIKTLKDKLKRLDELVTKCPELEKQKADLKKNTNKEYHIRDPKKTKTQFVTSLDPNEIIGPEGAGANRYVVINELQNFLVTFENVDSALIAAQIVTIVDSLDKTQFDLSTFQFGNVTIDTRTFEVPDQRKEFVLEEILNDSISVRINGEIDLVTGVVTWQFTAIDRLTNDIPTIEGFLPPNKTKPEGEGSVSYSIKLLSTLSDGTAVKNKASIIFDTNDPIITNTWENKVDIGLPSSSITATRLGLGDSIKITFNGTDASSGIGYYNLYFKENNEQWTSFGGTVTNQIILEAPRGVKYSFYAVAIDNVGNLENKTPAADAIVDIQKLTKQERFSIYPNPANTEIWVKTNLVTTQKLKIRIMDITGQLIWSTNDIVLENSQFHITLPQGLNTGTYFVQLTENSGVFSIQKLLILD